MDPDDVSSPPVEFSSWRLALDAATTRRAYANGVGTYNPRCCIECACFRRLVQRDRLPAELKDLLDKSGVDPNQPAEVWGVPEVGFINAWWHAVGKILEGPTDRPRHTSSSDLRAEAGVTGVTTSLALVDSSLKDYDLIQIEFAWESPVVLAEFETIGPGDYDPR